MEVRPGALTAVTTPSQALDPSNGAVFVSQTDL